MFDPATGDLKIDSDIHFTTGGDAVQQMIQTRMQTFRGEWFLDLDEGVPYMENDSVSASEALLGARFDEIKTRQAFNELLVSTPGVAKVETLSVSFDAKTRVLSVSWRVTTEFGDTVSDILEV